MFHDRIAEARFAELQKQYGFQWCIETGTHLGVGAFRASQYCNVITIDISEEFHNKAIKNWIYEGCVIESLMPYTSLSHGDKKIVSVLGNSAEKISEVAAHFNLYEQRPICFYLDAHWNDYWPLLDELKTISHLGFLVDKKLSDGAVIIIHDFKVPGKDFAYDHYGVDLDYNYVKDALAAINPNYRIEYNDKCDPRDEPYSSARGILYALP